MEVIGATVVAICSREPKGFVDLPALRAAFGQTNALVGPAAEADGFVVKSELADTARRGRTTNERDEKVMLEPLVTAAGMRNFDRSPTPIASDFPEAKCDKRLVLARQAGFGGTESAEVVRET
jgi:hypothetical protein